MIERSIRHVPVSVCEEPIPSEYIYAMVSANLYSTSLEGCKKWPKGSYYTIHRDPVGHPTSEYRLLLAEKSYNKPDSLETQKVFYIPKIGFADQVATIMAG